MNFMRHIMLDAAVLRVYYKSMKCDVSFTPGSLSAIFRWAGHFSYTCKNFILLATMQEL